MLIILFNFIRVRTPRTGEVTDAGSVDGFVGCGCFWRVGFLGVHVRTAHWR